MDSSLTRKNTPTSDTRGLPPSSLGRDFVEAVRRRGPLIVMPKSLESRVPNVRTGFDAGEFQSNKIARNYARARTKRLRLKKISGAL